ncbi:uncharacterized protein LOC121727757 isoform X1 [Aricia agestis]|uniref:uncharacterized protein LOC121727757 isoform X1 n=1 Tax=Aricia agestis TaxID=91739 RepID=UPI001C208017|nr:uncharacterized protein LOC121727757 isoform X1 [Aricia agestis]
MESLPPTPILGFNPDTLRDVRRQFDLDDVAKIHESVDLIEAWLQKQDYHVKKDYDRKHLERAIIFNKGSVEKAKSKIDNICRFRALHPKYFGPITREQRLLYPGIVDCILPKMTSEHERVYLLRNDAKKFEHGLLHYYKYVIALAEYEMAHDYNNGVIAIFDYMDVDMFVLMKHTNIVEMHLALMIMTEGFGMRVKGLHILSKNKGIGVVVKIFKRVLSKKLANRLQVHKSFDTLYDYVPKDVLPVEYGGPEKSLRTLYEDNLNEITSQKFQKHLIEMSKAVTNEKLRRKGKVGVSTDNDIPCTFGTLTID